MLEIFSTLLTGVLSGGATGLFGVLLQRYYDFQHRKLEIEVVKLNHENSIKLAELESARASERNSLELQVAERQLAEVEATVDAESLQAALAADRATYSSPDAQKRLDFAGKFVVISLALVDTLRGLIRPGMTAYLCGLVTVMFFWVRDLAVTYGVTLTATQVHDLMLQIVTSILYVFTVCTLFWFGTRPTKKG